MRLHNRQVKAAFWTDTQLIKELPRDGRLFYQGTWQLADDSGCLDDDPLAFKIHLFPADADITIDIIEQFRDALVAIEKLIPYEANGKKCLYLKNFHKHQAIKNPAPPETPLPPWIEWVPYNSNPRMGKYVINPSLLNTSYELLTDNLQSSSNHNRNLEPEPKPEPVERVQETPDGVGSRSEDLTPYNQIVGIYNQMCLSLPRVQAVSESRKKAMRLLWKRYPGLDWIQELFKKTEASDFLSGRDGKWTGCGFDWLLKEANMVKVLEGNYNNKETCTIPNQRAPDDKKKEDKYRDLYAI